MDLRTLDPGDKILFAKEPKNSPYIVISVGVEYKTIFQHGDPHIVDDTDHLKPLHNVATEDRDLIRFKSGRKHLTQDATIYGALMELIEECGWTEVVGVLGDILSTPSAINDKQNQNVDSSPPAPMKVSAEYPVRHFEINEE